MSCVVRAKGQRLGGLVLAILTGVIALLLVQPALACSVCAGDPNSALSQGAQAGMLVLLGVIGVVLTGLTSLLVFWMRRAANLRALEVLQALPVQATDLEG